MKRNLASILSKKSFCYLTSAVLLALVAANFASAQTYEAWTEKKISEIRAQVSAINNGAAKYAKRTKTIEGIALEGAEATFYRSGKDLRKITADIYGETYNQTGEFYYSNGKLIFAFLKRNQYDTQIGMDAPPKVVRTEEQRFYFAADGRLIRLLVGKKELKPGDEKYSELRNEIMSISSKLKDS